MEKQPIFITSEELCENMVFVMAMSMLLCQIRGTKKQYVPKVVAFSTVASVVYTMNKHNIKVIHTTRKEL